MSRRPQQPESKEKHPKHGPGGGKQPQAKPSGNVSPSPSPSHQEASQSNASDPPTFSAEYLRLVGIHAIPTSDTLVSWILDKCPGTAQSDDCSALIKAYCEHFDVPDKVRSMMHGIRINGNWVRHAGVQMYRKMLPYDDMTTLLQYQSYAKKPAMAASVGSSEASSSAPSPSPFPDGPYRKPCLKRDCPRTGDCKYWHPGDLIPEGGVRKLNKDGSVAGPTQEECFYGNQCTRKSDCRRWHPTEPLPAGGLTKSKPPPSRSGAHSASSPSLAASSSSVSSATSVDSRFPAAPYKQPCHHGASCRSKAKENHLWHPGDPIPPGGVRPRPGDETTLLPTIECRNGDACRWKGTKCTYFHPSDAFPPGGILPRVPSETGTPSVSSSRETTSSSTAECRNGDACRWKGTKCTFSHPSDSPSAAGTPSASSNREPRRGQQSASTASPSQPRGSVQRGPRTPGKDGPSHGNSEQRSQRGASRAPSAKSSGQHLSKAALRSRALPPKATASVVPSRSQRASTPTKRGSTPLGKKASSAKTRVNARSMGNSASGDAPSSDDDESDSGDSDDASDLSDISDISDRSDISDESDQSYQSDRSDISSLSQSTARSAISSTSLASNALTKTLEEREEERQLAEYPVYREKETLMQILEEEGLLLIRSAPGTADFSQLPQYAVEMFGGIVLSIQSSFFAARYLAERLADEYEGEPLAKSKSIFLHSASNPIPPPSTHIIVISVHDFLNMASDSEWMDALSVGLLYDIHHRTWQSDLALGILMAKQQQSDGNFRLVLSSADEMDSDLTKTLGADSPMFDFPAPLVTLETHHQPLKLSSAESSAEISQGSAEEEAKVERAIAKQILKQVILHLRSGALGHCVVFANSNIQIGSLMEKFKEMWNSSDVRTRKRPKDRSIRIIAAHERMRHNQLVKALNLDTLPEEDRAVIFTTPIAEYMLPLPEVSLVIDTGMVKLNIDGLWVDALVPKSTALLRQRLVGSLETLPDGAPCTYVQLYVPTTSTHRPSILMSNLDSVCLTMLKLGLSPVSFPLSTRPDQQLLRDTLDKLTRLECVNRQGEQLSLTKRGEAWIQLGFVDPRWASFVMEATERYHQSEMASRIAALLNHSVSYIHHHATSTANGASSSSFAQAANTGNKHQDRSDFRSDIRFYLNGFEEWINLPDAEPVPTPSKRGPSTPATPLPGPIGATRTVKTREMFAQERGYNHGVLTKLLQESRRIEACALKFATMGPRIPVSSDDAIGRSLVFAFPDNIAEVLVPEKPSSGVYLPRVSSPNGGCWAKLSRQSVICSSTAFEEPISYIISMSQKQVSDDLVVLESCQPIQLDWIQDATLRALIDSKLRKFSVCYKQSNVHARFHYGLNTKLSEMYGRDVYVTFDSVTLTLQVLCAKALFDAVQKSAAAIMKELIDHQLDYETYVRFGATGVLTLRGGLTVLDFDEDPSKSRRVALLPPVSVKDAADFVSWCATTAKCSTDDISWHSFKPRSAPVKQGEEEEEEKEQPTYESASIVAFVSKSLAATLRAAIDQLPVSNDRSHAIIMDDRRMIRPHLVGLHVTGSNSDCEAKLQAMGLPKDTRPSDVHECYLTITAVHSRDAGSVEPLLQQQVDPTITVISRPSPSLPGAVNLTVSVKNVEQAQACQNALVSQKLLPNSVMDPTTSSIAKVSYDLPTSDRNVTFTFPFTQLSEASAMLARVPGAYAFAEVRLHRHFAHLYSDIQASLVSTVRLNFKSLTNVKLVQRKQKAISILLNGRDARELRLAVESLEAALAPTSLPVGGHKWRSFYTFLHNKKVRLQTPNAKLHLDLIKDQVVSAEIYGPKQAQAQAVVEIGLLASQFRFEAIDISSIKSQITSSNTKKKLSSIILANDPSSTVQNHVDLSRGILCIFAHIPDENSNQQLGRSTPAASSSSSPSPSSSSSTSGKRRMRDLATPDAKDKRNEALVTDRQFLDIVSQMRAFLAGMKPAVVQMTQTCVYCQKRDPDSVFKICGHSFCADCLAKDVARNLPPISCRQCQTVVAVSNFEAAGTERLADLVTTSVKLQLSQPLSLIPPFLQAFSVCPSAGCGAVRRMPKAVEGETSSYAVCPECAVSGCSLCGVVSNEAHHGRSCADFAQYQVSLKQVDQLEDLFRAAETFVSGHFEAGLGRATEYIRNPGLAQGCPAMLRFAAGVRAKGGPAVLKSVIFAWHGTLPASIQPICHGGFDPSKRGRIGQVYGRGEYFGQAAATSRGYATGTDALILCAIIRNIPEVSTHGSFCHVVDNPLSRKSGELAPLFCLPLLLVRFPSTTPGPALAQFAFAAVEKRSNFTFGGDAIASSSSSSTKSKDDEEATLGIRWSWWWDNVPAGSLPAGMQPHFEPYMLPTARDIEAGYQHYKSGQGPSRINITVVCYAGDRPRPYIIDFAKNKQISNLSHERDLKRDIIDVGAGNWCYMDDSGKWAAYDASSSADIERNWVAFKSASCPGLVTLRISGRPDPYRFDFVRSAQVNPTSGTERQILRRTSK